MAVETAAPLPRPLAMGTVELIVIFRRSVSGCRLQMSQGQAHDGRKRTRWAGAIQRHGLIQIGRIDGDTRLARFDGRGRLHLCNRYRQSRAAIDDRMFAKQNNFTARCSVR